MIEMDVGLELEDDVFFADLSQRIALLIMDDDGGEAALRPQRPSISFQGFSHASQPAVPSLLFYEQACRGGGVRGTGVFIPQCSLPRRKQRGGRSRHASKSKALASTAAMDTTDKNNKNGRSRQQQQPPEGLGSTTVGEEATW